MPAAVIPYNTAVNEAEYKPEFKLVKDSSHASYGMSAVRILEKIDRVIMASRRIIQQNDLKGYKAS